MVWPLIYAYSGESTIVTRLLNILCHRAISCESNLQEGCRNSKNNNNKETGISLIFIRSWSGGMQMLANYILFAETSRCEDTSCI